MTNFLLLALAFGLAHANDYAELQGNWDTIAIAADNNDKIKEEGPMRLYVRELSCNEDCSEMGVTFYVNANNQCSKTKVIGYKQADGTYRTQFEGDNIFQPVYATPENIVFTNRNVDRAGVVTNFIYIVGKSKHLTPEQHEKLVEYAREKKIPEENIHNVLATVRPMVHYIDEFSYDESYLPPWDEAESMMVDDFSHVFIDSI
ncbi:odorant-binding protein-like [Phodopus roborovskii]|uniref:odorant-binding protein n=1 Tax=Phodopus roborovskii TaxID=109678 RepID=UPI0021E4AABB|nr:odorant-binding protein [Phodopus roborovskii]XP_051035193.1 odorant-binding protein-like [Phodopus roborovskii]